MELDAADVKRIHNEPNWGGLPPCECPVCRPDLSEEIAE